jgi:hypothetical protein
MKIAVCNPHPRIKSGAGLFLSHKGRGNGREGKSDNLNCTQHPLPPQVKLIVNGDHLGKVMVDPDKAQ